MSKYTKDNGITKDIKSDLNEVAPGLDKQNKVTTAMEGKLEPRTDSLIDATDSQSSTDSEGKFSLREFEIAHSGKSASKVKKKLSPKIIILNSIFAVIVCFLIISLVSVIIAKSNGQSVSFFGLRMYYVQSESMEPTLRKGQTFLAKMSKDDDIYEVGDIIVFHYDDLVVTHRVVEIIILDNGVNGYKTRGDNPQNSTDLDYRTSEDIIAKLILKLF